MPFSRLFQRRRYAVPARMLYETIVLQSRRPDFYLRYGIPDNIPGRFDMIALHAWLVMRRLKACGPARADEAGGLSQALFDLMFADMDHNLRELGVGDLSVGKKVKAMAQGFYGRIAAYDGGLAEGEEALVAALSRNLFATGTPTASQLSTMSRYLRNADAALSSAPEEVVLGGRISFPEPDVSE